MIKPNNIPCKGFHKEVVRRTDNTSRVDIYIFTPTHLTEKHSSLKKKLRSASDVKKFFKETKKLGITFPKTCTIAKFTKFKTKVSDLDEKERKLLRAAAFIGRKVPTLDKEEKEEENMEDKIKKIKDKINNKILEEAHPEILNINNTEMMALSKCIRNKSGSIIDPLHQTVPFMTKYEKTRILGLRAKQLNDGADSFISVTEQMLDGYTIAKKELMEKKIPFIIRRPLPNGASEYWKISDLEILC